MSQPGDPKEQQKSQWHDAASVWERLDAWFQSQTAPVTEWMIDAAGIKPGGLVLDLACGVGQPALTAAERVLPGGTVTATDLAPAMVEAVRKKAAAAELSNVAVMEMDAENIDFPAESFDAVTCRWGLMFCPDPGRAAAEIRRVLRPGGRVALTVWDVPARNTFFTAITGPLAKATGAPPPDPSAPGLFRLAQPGDLEALLCAAAFRKVRVESRELTFEYASAEEYWEMQSELAAPLKAAIRTLPAAAVAELREKVIGSLTSEHDKGVVRLKATPLCASAAR